MFIITRVVFCLIVWSCILFVLSSVGTQAHTLIPITEISEEEKQRLRDSVFMLEIERIVLDETETGNCTGFFVKGKAGQVLFVTAFHCVDAGSSYKVIIGDEEAGLEVVGLDGIHDLALLKLKTEHQIPEQSILSLEETTHSLPPQMLYMPGFPSKNHSDSEQKYHLTQGEFKSTRCGVSYEFATNNSSLKGNSGGPVISSKSQKVVGIVIQASVNLADFIPIDKLKALMEEEDIECPSLEECVEKELDHMKQEALNGNIQAQDRLIHYYDKIEKLNNTEKLNEAVKLYKEFAKQGNLRALKLLRREYYPNKAQEFEKYKDVTELECETKKECEDKSEEFLLDLHKIFFVWWYSVVFEKHEFFCANGIPKQTELPPQAQAMFFVAKAYESGKNVDKDVMEAVKWYKKAAEQGYAPAQNRLGLLYLGKSDEESGEFPKYKDVTELECETKKECEEKAQYWFKLAADQGDPEASNQRIMLINRQIDELNRQIDELELLADLAGLAIEGDEEALKRLYSLAKQGVSRAFLKLKELPQAQAMFFVAEIYESGVGDVDKDVTEAVKWYQKAAEKKLADITKNRYKPSPYKRTVTEIKQAAEQGNIQAQYDLGTLYECLEESIQAIYWYKKTFNTSTEWCKANDVQECN